MKKPAVYPSSRLSLVTPKKRTRKGPMGMGTDIAIALANSAHATGASGSHSRIGRRGAASAMPADHSGRSDVSLSSPFLFLSCALPTVKQCHTCPCELRVCECREDLTLRALLAGARPRTRRRGGCPLAPPPR
eukprot:scaffold311759_cov31-Tisochrysis_lutea.AAC.1